MHRLQALRKGPAVRGNPCGEQERSVIRASVQGQCPGRWRPHRAKHTGETGPQQGARFEHLWFKVEEQQIPLIALWLLPHSGLKRQHSIRSWLMRTFLSWICMLYTAAAVSVTSWLAKVRAIQLLKVDALSQLTAMSQTCLALVLPSLSRRLSSCGAMLLFGHVVYIHNSPVLR